MASVDGDVTGDREVPPFQSTDSCKHFIAFLHVRILEPQEPKEVGS